MRFCTLSLNCGTVQSPSPVMKGPDPSSAAIDDPKFIRQRGKELRDECEEALRRVSPTGKVPQWVLNAWRHLTNDVFAIKPFEPPDPEQTLPPRKQAKQVAQMQYLVNLMRSDPLMADRSILEPLK